MLNLAKGYKIYEPERLNEEYEVTDDVTLMANVDVEKIKEVFQHFIVMHDEPLFFILELPVTCDRENPVAPGILEETHKDVYYIDGCSQEECLVLLERYGELLINDGMNRFGYGCHESQDEIMLDKYNVVTIYSQQLSNYNDFFEAHGIEKVESLITAWDTFSDATPGQAERCDYEGKSVYDLPEELEDWGNKFVENLSKDMKMRFPSAKGYSVRNLKYMKKFAQTFTEDDVDEYGLGRITWSHHQILMSKVSNREEYIWYLEKTLEHKWSVDDLTSQVKSQLYERQAVANKISNFERRLPAEQKNMVLSTMKDPYMFDFIDYTEEMLETDIENELVKNVTSLLMELGTGFAFMGQQYHLEVGEKDFYIDLLFYNTKLRCYVAIDLKTGEFKPEQAGKMNFYLSALDDLVKAPEDNPSVGLILCRDENRTIAEYALRDMSKPIGVSEYHLCTDLPLDLKNALPAVEDIRSRIDMKK